MCRLARQRRGICHDLPHDAAGLRPRRRARPCRAGRANKLRDVAELAGWRFFRRLPAVIWLLAEQLGQNAGYAPLSNAFR